MPVGTTLIRFFFIISVTLLLPLLAVADAAPPVEKLRQASLEILVNGQLMGSGWLVASHGLAITAAHLLPDTDKIEVLSTDYGRLQGRVIRRDLGHDLALIKVERTGEFFTPLVLSPSLPPVATPLFSYGTVMNRHHLLIDGISAAEETTFEWNSINQCYTEVIPVSATTAEGISGAPWVDGLGQVVGVQSGMIVAKGGLAGIAFAAPASAVAKLMGPPPTKEPGSLGAVIAEPWEGAIPDFLPKQRGLRVLKTIPGGSAEQAGVVSGDIIVAINRTPVTYRDDLLRTISQNDAGEIVTLSVIKKDGQQEEVLAKLNACRTFPFIKRLSPNL